jgi:hypothetical protein
MKKRCLLIIPRSFYSFAKVIENGLRDLGYDIIVANDEYPEGIFGKIMSKLDFALTRWITRVIIKKKYLADQHYNLVLVIKGRGIDEKTATELTLHGDVVLGYHFDSFGYDRGPARWIKCLPRVCTFDYRDAKEHDLTVVELFSSMPEVIKSGGQAHDISAIMRNHSDRLMYLDMVMKAFKNKSAFIYIFEANVFTFVVNFVRHPLLYLKYRNYISFRSLPYDDYVHAIANSDFTIDYAHPKQTGITIRCFEALGAGTRIITNNPSIRNCSLFDNAEVIVFPVGSDIQGLINSIANCDIKRVDAVQRTVKDFLLDLIEGNFVKVKSEKLLSEKLHS